MKIILKTIFIVTVFIVSRPMGAQNFSPDEKKMISKAVDSLVNLYGTYSTFTEDDMEVSPYYKRKFIELFQSGKTQICMDLTTEIHKPVSVTKYVDFADKTFKEGLGVNISDIRLGQPEEAASGRGYEVKVLFKKKVSGYRKRGLKYENTVGLVMTVRFDKVDGTYKIASLFNEKQDKRAVNQKKTNEINLNIIPAFTFITARNDSATNFASTGSFSVQLNINYYKYFQINEKLYYGAGLGAGLSEYHATLSFDYYVQPESVNTITDSDNDTLSYLVNFAKTKDKISVSFFDIILWPARFRYYDINSNFEYFISFGIKFSVPYKTESILTGIDTTVGNYHNIPLKLDDVDYYGYGPQKINIVEHSMPFSSLIVMGIINAGVSYTIGKSLVFGIAFNFDFAFNNLNKESSPYLAYRNDKEIKNRYNSIITISKSSRPVSTGLLLGLTYRF